MSEEKIISKGFVGHRQAEAAKLPPGQYVTHDFPVLSATPTPKIPLEKWEFTLTAESGDTRKWNWQEFRALPSVQITTDIHCVTRWSKLDTTWQCVTLDTLLGQVEHTGTFLLAHCDGGYTTNLPIADVLGGQAWVAFNYGGNPLAAEHGGPARLLVPHLYFWKSAKWVRRLELFDHDVPGFWENYGYNNYGDPWREQRYAGD